MSKYSIHSLQSEEDDFFFGVYEEQSEQVIDFFYFHEDAEKIIDFMERGGAFAGFTPAFMLRSVPRPKSDLNTGQKAPNQNVSPYILMTKMNMHNKTWIDSCMEIECVKREDLCTIVSRIFG